MTCVSSKVLVCLAFSRHRENAARIFPDDMIAAKSRMSTPVLPRLPETSQNPKESSR